MFRTLFAMAGLLSFAVLVAEGMTLGLLVARGQLDSERIHSFQLVLAGELKPVESAIPAEETPTDAVPASAAERELAANIYAIELTAQADDLALLHGLLESESLLNDEHRNQFEQQQLQFNKRLAEIRAQREDEVRAQTRAILAALSTRDGVAYLMKSSEQDGLILLQGLPERNVAKLLQEFAAGTDEERQRGQSYFAAMAAGQPEKALLEETQDVSTGTTPKPGIP